MSRALEEWNRRRDRYQRLKELTAADNDDDVCFEDAYREVRERERERKPARNSGSGSRSTSSRRYDGNDKKV